MSEQQRGSAPVVSGAVIPTTGGQAEISLEDFIIAACRLTSAISDSAVFSENGAGTAEWVLLKVLRTEPLTMTELVRRTSLSRQRVGLLVKELLSKRFVSVSARSDGDRRTRIVEVLPRGIEALEQISSRLESLGVPNAPKRLSAAVKQTQVLLRVLRQQKRINAQAHQGS